MLAALILFMHRENIHRLLAGQEPRIGAKKSGADGADA
jgi:glycerol-3-phosphate acyltransferase PlsY